MNHAFMSDDGTIFDTEAERDAYDADMRRKRDERKTPIEHYAAKARIAEAHTAKLQNQFNKIVEAEQYGCKAFDSVKYWVDDPQVRQKLKRAEYLLAELRFAAQFLCDPASDERTKAEAAHRLVQSIVNCE